jgi:predicted enzyme related to lactoylglutathione lyase
MSSPHTLCWVDIPVADLDRASLFYSTVLGEPVVRQTSEGFSFGMLPHAGDGVTGCLAHMPENRPSATGPLIYLSVEGRLDAALASVTAAGGLVITPKMPIGPYGYRAVIQDSEGNRLALHSTVA